MYHADVATLVRLATCLRATPQARDRRIKGSTTLGAGFGLGTIWLRASRPKLLDAWLALPQEVPERFNELLDEERGH